MKTHLRSSSLLTVILTPAFPQAPENWICFRHRQPAFAPRRPRTLPPHRRAPLWVSRTCSGPAWSNGNICLWTRSTATSFFPAVRSSCWGSRRRERRCASAPAAWSTRLPSPRQPRLPAPHHTKAVRALPLSICASPMSPVPYPCAPCRRTAGYSDSPLTRPGLLSDCVTPHWEFTHNTAPAYLKTPAWKWVRWHFTAREMCLLVVSRGNLNYPKLYESKKNKLQYKYLI